MNSERPLTTELMCADEFRRMVKPGDSVAVQRRIYSTLIYYHYLLFIGRRMYDDGTYSDESDWVIHVASEIEDFNLWDLRNAVGPELLGIVTNIMGNKLTAGCEIVRGAVGIMPRWARFNEVVGEDLCQLDNSFDEYFKPFLPAEIIARAIAQIHLADRQKCKYSLRNANCEHFVKYCRNGVGDSKQVRIGESIVVGAAFGIQTSFTAYNLTNSVAKSVGCGVIGGAAVGLIFYGVTSWDAHRSTQREVGGIGGDWTQTVQTNNHNAIEVVRLVLGFGSKLTALKIVGAIEYIKRFP